MPSLYVLDTGDGDAVVLLHSHGLSGRQWRTLTSELVPLGLRVLAVDLTGQGRSEPWPEPEPFEFSVDVEHVGDLVRAAEPVHLVGHSYGGTIALHVARALPGSVRTLCLYDPVMFTLLDPGEDRDALAALAGLDVSWEPGDHDRWLRTFVDFWGGTPGAWGTLSDDAHKELHRVAWVIREAVRTMSDDKTSLRELSGLNVPTLLMTGERSPLPERRTVERLAKAIPNVRLEVIPGAGHFGPMTHTREVNAHIIAAIGNRLPAR